jgi:hypothetical protein
MTGRIRLVALALLVAGVTGASIALSLSSGPQPIAGPGSTAGASPADGTGGPGSPGPTVVPTPTPLPVLGGTELYGYLPYWEMSESMTDYLRSVPLTTVALFSVSARRNGALDTRPVAYDRITGSIGRRLIAEAQDRQARVELVFTSFGADKNAVFFGRIPRRPEAPPSGAPSTSFLPAGSASTSPAPSATPAAPPWQRAVRELVELAVDLGVDGINVDVELLDEADRDAYGEFLVALRAGLVAANPDARLSVATEAGLRGVGNAAEAAAAGVDRLFLMGYDYHWSGSQPGASSPVERSDGLYDLRWSIDRYVEAGVPRDRILLGLPLYGMSWRTTGPDRTAPVVSSGQAWIPNRHFDILLARGFMPARDPLEIAEFFIVPDGNAWRVTYYDSASTLRVKLALALDNGLAGGGFWAMGYERGLPGYVDLMRDFRTGKVKRSEAPPR